MKRLHDSRAARNLGLLVLALGLSSGCGAETETQALEPVAISDAASEPDPLQGDLVEIDVTELDVAADQGPDDEIAEVLEVNDADSTSDLPSDQVTPEEVATAPSRRAADAGAAASLYKHKGIVPTR